MIVGAVFLVLALAPTVNHAQIRPSDLPLVISKAEYNPGQSFFEFSLRNEGSVPVIAWSVGTTWRYPNGAESSGGHSVDSYEEAAGVATAPRNNRVLGPGETIQRRLPVVTAADGTSPYVLELQARAVVLEGNQVLGDPLAIQSIFTRRTDRRKAWAEIVSVLEAARTAATDAVQPFDRAVAALDSLASERSLRGAISRRCLYKMRNVDRAGLDRPQALDQLVHEARQHADAAERFATRPAVK